MAEGVYNREKANLLNKLVDHSNGGDTFKIILLDNSHSFDPDDNVLSDISTNEIGGSGTGYTTGGETLANQAVTQDDSNDRAVWSADDVQWTTATFTAYHAVIYDDTLAGDDLVGSFDFGGAKTVTGGTFTIAFPGNRILLLV